MKRKSHLVFLFMFTLVFTLLVVPFYEPVYSYTNRHNVSVSSNQVQFGPAIISIDYDVVIDVDRPSSLDPGESFTVTVYPRGGTVTYNIEVFDRKYSIPQNLNLGDEIAFNIVTGIDAYISTSASSNAIISGPVSNTQQTLHWQSPTSQIIRSSVDNNVGSSGDITVRIPIRINIDAGLNLNFLGIIKENLGEKSLGTISAYPIIVEEIPINRPITGFSGVSLLSPAFYLIYLIIIIIIIIVAIIAVSIKKRKRKKDVYKTSVTPTFIYDTVKEIQRAPEKKSDTVVKETIIDSKAYWAYPINLKEGDKLIGEISSNGNFIVYLTDREHFKEFQEKKKRDKMQFYEGGRSEGFRHNISYVIPHNGEYLLAILNEGKSTINVKLDYFVLNVD